MGSKVVCGKCGGTFEARGFKVHETFCKGEKKEDHKKIEGSVDKCHECGSNDIVRIDHYQVDMRAYGANASRYLSTAYKKAVSAGYTHVCNKCGEVLK